MKSEVRIRHRMPPGALDTRVMHLGNSSLDFKPKMKIGLLCDSRCPAFSKHLLRTYYVPGVGDKVMSSICGWGGLCDPGVAHVRGCSHPNNSPTVETPPLTGDV